MEFACDGSKTWIVQARPATGLGFPDGGDEDTVWSNVNVGEALPGVATPFTWSVAGAFSEAGFRRAFAALGCRVPKHARLVGNVHGRIYLNLTQFMRIAAQVPFLDPRTLVELGGGWGGDELAVQVQDVSHRGFYARLPMTASRLFREQLRLDDDVEAFEAFAEKQWRAQSALDLAILPDEGVARRLRDIQALLERTGTVMLTSASSTLGAHLALRTILRRVAPADADGLAQSLTSGIRDLESARPGMGIMHVAALARREPEACAVIERESTTGFDAIPEGPTRRALQSFIELYGDRAVREAELSTPRWKEDPRPVLRMLRAALRTDTERVEGTLARAKAQADDEMARLVPMLNVVEQTLIRHLVVRAQRAARLRERMRAWVTRVLGMLREAALDADRRLLRRDPDLASDWRALVDAGSSLAGVRSVFFLTIDEVVGALRAARTDLAPLVRARRGELARDQARPDPPATFVGVPPPVVMPPSGGRPDARARGEPRGRRGACARPRPRRRDGRAPAGRDPRRAHDRRGLDSALPRRGRRRDRARWPAVARGRRRPRVRCPQRRQRRRRDARHPHRRSPPRRRRSRRRLPRTHLVRDRRREQEEKERRSREMAGAGSSSGVRATPALDLLSSFPPFFWGLNLTVGRHAEG